MTSSCMGELLGQIWEITSSQISLIVSAQDLDLQLTQAGRTNQDLIYDATTTDVNNVLLSLNYCV